MKVPSKNISRWYDVLRSPVVTEKSTSVSEFNQYVFDVNIRSTKTEIKKAVESVFNVKVQSVNTLIRQGKVKVFKGRRGRRSDVKRAFVSLDASSKIDFTSAGVI
jgi:large subunit ribosomal protein L23